MSIKFFDMLTTMDDGQLARRKSKPVRPPTQTNFFLLILVHCIYTYQPMNHKLALAMQIMQNCIAGRTGGCHAFSTLRCSKHTSKSEHPVGQRAAGCTHANTCFACLLACWLAGWLAYTSVTILLVANLDALQHTVIQISRLQGNRKSVEC
ncbi:hypothetical protein B0T20DRAFT_69766 [Sordaria brevicollis]|uniref:Uncharacterized protein n=1 Tax=Sordaria brevicollis TaxID=83679 RepID=A0AAE0U625_SORBR|nr:hypothetical protein B0T20DRAFT_69766 [Sordaria brevicollis]